MFFMATDLRDNRPKIMPTKKMKLKNKRDTTKKKWCSFELATLEYSSCMLSGAIT